MTRRADPPTWTSYRASIGDRSEMFALIAALGDIQTALYPGSYLDLAPSTAIPAVTYVDTDRRAARYFADPATARDELLSAAPHAADHEIAFLLADYTEPLPVAAGAFDALISLYAGPVWDHCSAHLRPGGVFVANASHGDASVAALDPRLELVAAIHQRDGRYRLDTDALATYLVPVTPAAADAARIRASGRGIRYTRSAFAYVFRLRP